jgi:enoyl-[acyl-carrier protein] reductase II
MDSSSMSDVKLSAKNLLAVSIKVLNLFLMIVSPKMVAPPIKTRITRLLKCRYPIILPGMSWISKPELVAAVSNAGGVGILATGPLSPKETEESIQRIRQLTDKNFGVGVTLLMPGSKENAEIALREQVGLINISLGKAQWIADEIHSYGGTVLATVTNRQHAQAALDAGADALMVTGYEAAAHGSEVGNISLIPSFAQSFPDIPIVAAGGFATGSGLSAALTLGADAIAMGSRFAVSRESSLSQAAKDAICSSSEVETIYGSNFDGISARVLKTPISQRLMNQPPALPIVIWRALKASRDFSIPIWKVLPGLLTQWDKLFAVAQFGAATKYLESATIHGDLLNGVQFVGQSQGMIHSIEGVDEIVQKIMADAASASIRTASCFSGADLE